MKRSLTCALLIVVSVFFFWYAISGINTQSPSAGGNKSTSRASGTPKPASPAPKPAALATSSTSAGNTSGGNVTVAANPTSSSGSITIAASSPSNSPTTSYAANPLSCISKCQTTNSSCQSGCYQQYSVTNQTQYWNQCMQSCGTKLAVCSNDCIAGIPAPSTSPTAILPPPTQALLPPFQSAPDAILADAVTGLFIVRSWLGDATNALLITRREKLCLANDI